MSYYQATRQMLSTSPIFSNCLFCVGTWTLGDIAAQKLEHSSTVNAIVDKTREFVWNQERTLHFAFFGVMINGPILAKWYPYLSRTSKKILASPSAVSVMSKLPPACSKWSAPVTKVAIETIIFDIPFLALFYSYINVAEGGTLQTCKQKLDNKLLDSFITGLAIWPVVQLTNFRFVPTLYQPYVVNSVCVAWDGYLSYKNNLTEPINEKSVDITVVTSTHTSNVTKSVLGNVDDMSKFIPKISREPP